MTLDVRESRVTFNPGPEFSHVEDCISIAKEVLPMKLRGKPVNIDTGYTLKAWAPHTERSHTGVLTVEKDGKLKTVNAYQKIMSLLDAYRWMRFKERPNQPFLWMTQPAEITDSENQAYVDIVATSLASKLKLQHKIPHFCEMYGSFRGLVDKFYYNLEDDLEDIRFTRWFWEGLEAKEFGLRIVEKSTGRVLSMDEIKNTLKPDEEFLTDNEDEDDEEDEGEDEDDTSETSSLSAEHLDADETDAAPFADLEEASIATNEEKVAVNRKKPATPKTVSTLSTASDDTEDSFSEEYTVHAELYNVPVAVMFCELQEGTMDSLLETDDSVPIQSSPHEVQWGAWMFQVCAALSQLQRYCNMTHNDLHTNNVLWTTTEEEFLVYKDNNGRMWKVPTFGKLFTIIDFGRSIFLLNGHWYIGSDYDEDHDADGMYNFGPIEDPDKPKVIPNKSFDLCRLSCSLVRGLFPTIPDALPRGALITKDGDWEVRETAHPLFNLLWTWLKCDDGTNILEAEDGTEKFPGFELYSIIAATVHDGVPDVQLTRKMLSVFAVKQPIPGPFIPLLL